MATVIKSQPTSAGRSNDLPWLFGTAILALIGIAAWVVQLSQSISVTGISQAVVWGVYIATFFTLAGVASGLVMLSAFADLEFIPGLQPVRRRLLVAGLACYIASGFMILMDIGRPLRVFNMIFSPNFSSPFVWDFGSLALSVIVTAIYLFSASKAKILPWLAAIVAGLVVAVEGWILSMSAGSSLWHGGTTPAIFLIESLISASALLLLVKSEAAGWLRRSLLLLLPALFLLNLFELSSVLYSGEPDAQAAAQILVANPLFWAQVALGIALPFVLLAWASHSRSAVITAAILAVAGVFVGKSLFLVAGQTIPFFQAPVAYAPTTIEIGGVIGIIGLAGLLYLLGRRFVIKEAA